MVSCCFFLFCLSSRFLLFPRLPLSSFLSYKKYLPLPSPPPPPFPPPGTYPLTPFSHPVIFYCPFTSLHCPHLVHLITYIPIRSLMHPLIHLPNPPIRPHTHLSAMFYPSIHSLIHFTHLNYPLRAHLSNPPIHPHTHLSIHPHPTTSSPTYSSSSLIHSTSYPPPCPRPHHTHARTQATSGVLRALSSLV